MARKAKAGEGREPAADAIDPIILAALRLAEQLGWENVALRDVAEEAAVPFSQLYRRYRSRQAILDGFARAIDAKLLAASESDPPEGSARDRLFDLVMRRLDLLQPHREALRAVLHAGRRDPLAAACGLRSLARSMASLLEAAGISSEGIAGLVRTKGLGAIYLATLRRWLADDSEDKAATMAALDRMLRRAEGWVGRLNRGPRRRAAGEMAAD
ncbi:MAG: TetR family transcriptional regulator [Dongiaceae bacterium]